MLLDLDRDLGDLVPDLDPEPLPERDPDLLRAGSLLRERDLTLPSSSEGLGVPEGVPVGVPIGVPVGGVKGSSSSSICHYHYNHQYL